MTKFLTLSAAALSLSLMPTFLPTLAMADHCSPSMGSSHTHCDSDSVEAISTHDHEDASEMTMVGDLHLTAMFIRETPPNARNAGGFVTIANGGSDDRLVAATSSVSQRAELHTMTMEDDVMRMRELEDGIALPAGETVELAPGGLHIMFIGLENGLTAGDSVPVSLTFEKAGDIDLMLPVVARSMEMNHSMDDEDHSHEGHTH